MADFRAIARQKAQKYGLDPHIFERQINAESGFNPGAGSGAGAVGIAQFMPATARGLGINPHDPVQSLDGAAKLMAGYVQKYGSYEKALRAYNAGPGAIQASHGFGETNAYVAKILTGGRDPGKLSARKAGGLSQTLGGHAAVPGYNVSSTAVSGGQPIALPDTGDASGLSQLLLQSVGQRPQGMAGGQIAAPAFSADQRYGPNTGAVRPVGVNPLPQSGVADQLAQLATVDTSLPPVGNTASSSTATGRVPGVPASGSPTSANPAIKNAAGGAKATLAWARSVIGTSETAGANHGPRIDQWEKAFGMSGQPWCAIFTSLAVTKGGAPHIARTASVAAVRGQAMSGQGGYQKGFVDPARAHAGDLILFGNDHIGLVESVGPKGITMIAGNDSNKVQRRVVAAGAGDIVRPKYK